MLNSKANISLLWLLIVALLGVFLRALPVFGISVNYNNVLHAHSHVAFLGWIFTALFTLISASFLQDRFITENRQKKQFNLIQISALGMLVSFLVQGYGAVSIFFCTLHMIASLWFAWSIYSTLKESQRQKNLISLKMLFASLAFMAFSSLGPLALPIISKTLGSNSSLYANAVYFYLHFQYNGWFIFALLAILFKRLEDNSILFSRRTADTLFVSLFVSCLLTFFLSVLWSKPPGLIWILAMAGATIQIVSLVSFFILIRNCTFKLSPLLKNTDALVLAAFALKIVLQLLSGIPALAMLANHTRHFIVAYIHLVVLGIVSLSIFGFYFTFGWLSESRPAVKNGLIIFTAGFIISEVLAVTEGVLNNLASAVPDYYLLQFIVSLAFPLGVSFIYFGRRKIIYLKTNKIFNSSIFNNPKYQS